MSARRTHRPSPLRPLRAIAPLAAALLVAGCVAHRRAEWLTGPAPDAYPVVQTLLGASLPDDGDLVLDDVSSGDPGAFAVADFDTIPTGGIVGMQPLTDGPVHVGLESALLIGWWKTDADTFGGASSPPLDVDAALWMFDLSLGPYVSTSMNRNVRVYAGAGGAMAIGVLSADSNELDDDPDGSAAAVGPYARAGLELLLGDGSFLGVGVRRVWAELDFGGDVSPLDLDGLQVFLTYSVGTTPFFAPPRW